MDIVIEDYLHGIVIDDIGYMLPHVWLNLGEEAVIFERWAGRYGGADEVTEWLAFGVFQRFWGDELRDSRGFP